MRGQDSMLRQSGRMIGLNRLTVKMVGEPHDAYLFQLVDQFLEVGSFVVNLHHTDEALGLEWKHLVNDGRTFVVDQKVNRFGKIVGRMKTKSGKREVDLHPDVTAELLAYKPKDATGLIWKTRENTPYLKSNLGRALMSKHTKGGWHQFRRYRNTWLRKNACLEDLRLFWFGHKPSEMGEVYSKMKDDLDTRLEWSAKIGLGFKIVPMSEFKIRKVGKPRGYIRKMAPARRLTLSQK
jgi:hypothetical protein